MPKAFGMHNP